MKKQIIATLAIISAGIIAGCGSSSMSDSLGTQNSIASNSTNNSSTSLTTSIAGKVADGYLVGATVFLDKNGNYQLDSGEPYTMTDANGAYTLKIDPADVGKYPIVALAIKGVTIDKDTNTAVPNSYVLCLHAVSVVPSTTGDVSGTVNNFISPISTLAREMMETGTFGTMQQAMDSVRTKLGLPAGTNMAADYIAANNTTMHMAAQNMVALMGSQMTQIIGAGGSNTAVEVNRYRGTVGTIFSNMSSIRGTNIQKDMTTLMGILTTQLPRIPATNSGLPFSNMSTTFRGMMNGVVTKIGGMMGGR